MVHEKIAVTAPAKLELIPEEKSFAADGKDLMYIRVNICDADGNRVMDDETEIHVTVEGAGTFVTMGSGNPCTEDQLTTPECHLYRGTAMIIIKSSQPGGTKVTASAEGIESAAVLVKAD